MAVIGLDLGGTKLSGAIFRNNGETHEYSSASLNKRTGNEVGTLIADFALELIRKGKSEGIEINAIGCCVPGIVYQNSGKVWAPNISGWEDFPLRDALRNNMGSGKIQIYLDNDRACSILGEVWMGAAKGCRDAIFLAVGTGIGAGIMSDGNIIRGQSDIAGAVGWLALNQPFFEKYFSVGCFEYHASGDGLSRVALEYLMDNPNQESLLKQSDELTSHHVFSAWEKGDPLATRVISEAIQYWGMASANLVSIFNPEMIIFGGGVFGPAVRLLNMVSEEARKWAQPISINQVKFVASSLGNNAGLFGAARIALKGVENSRYV